MAALQGKTTNSSQDVKNLLRNHLELKEALAALRRGQGLPAGKKVLIVLDQFEQWLHARKEEENTDLVQALRQCDGGRVQCLVLVRDDFWMAVTRFLTQLEIELLQGRNCAAADLFDVDHARKVLAAFGRAFGKLPEKSHETTREQKEFLNQAVSGLSQESKVICVRLAMFAEMMKGKTWAPATLKQVGGTEGVGITFLEDTFSSPVANPKHRLHQRAARAVLKALLPESGTDIKGHMRSHADLLTASGYGSHPKEFDDLIRILDSEIRLLTPTDPEGKEVAEESVSQAQPGQKYYQLTHDYLVHSLQDWLTRKQKETRRGRAELLLADRAVVWNARQENRQLPSLLQWCNIRWWTAKKNWTLPQRKMMRKASRFHAVRGLVVAATLALVGLVGWEGFGRLKAQTLRDRLLESSTADVPGVVKDMTPYRRWVDPLLHDASAKAEQENDRRKQLHVRLALLPVDAGQVEYLFKRLLKAEPPEVLVIREALLDHKQDLMERLWAVLENPKNDQDERFRAACALAAFAPDAPRWEKVSGDVSARLVIQNAFVLGTWAEALQPVGNRLLPPLASFLEDEKRSRSELNVIANVYKTFAEGQPDAFARLEKVLAERSRADASEEAKLALVKRQANVGVALVVMGRGDKVWPLLKHSPDPTLRSFLIDRLGPGGVDAKVLVARLGEEKEVSVKRAILLSLGEFGVDRLSQAERQNLLARLLQLYRDDPDPGIHGAAEWLLRKWEASDQLKGIDEELATGKVEGKRQWYVNRQGQTMMLVARPGEFWMGEGQERHRRQIGRSYAIANKEVTEEQFLRFRREQGVVFGASTAGLLGSPFGQSLLLAASALFPGRTKEHTNFKHLAPTSDCPMLGVSWYEAAEYCNWLSKQEGIPEEQWCYERNRAGQYGEGMKMAPNYLQRRGYRLPTEAEWEYGCRARAETGYCFGEPLELLGKYAWYDVNSVAKSHPVGLLKPNDLGLHDMHGNAWEMTSDVYQGYVRAGGNKAIGDIEYIKYVNSKDSCVLRGGSFVNQVSYVRSAIRFRVVPITRIDLVGFRPARTFR